MVGRWCPAAVAVLLLAGPILARGHDAPQATVQALLAAYDEGQYDVVDRTLAGQPKGPLAAELIRQGDRWVGTGTAEIQRRRRIVAGGVALEIVGVGLRDEWYSVYQAIEWGCRHVRATAPGSEAEHLWHLGSISLLHDGAGIAPSTFFADGHIVQHSLRRVPGSARIQLDAVIDEERGLAWLPPRRPGQAPLSPIVVQRFQSQVGDLVKRYVSLFSIAEVAEEAGLRLAGFQYRIGSVDEAIAGLMPLRRSADRHVAYVAAFLTGEALRRKGRNSEAMTAYRQALVFAPNAMSASLGLAATLTASGDIDGAIEAVKGAATPAAPVDPWRVFAYGSGREWPRWRDALRQELRR